MMNQEDLFKKTGNILKELQEQFDYLAQDPQGLSELELELFLANVHFLSDHVQILKKAVGIKLVKELPEHTVVNPTEIQTQPQVPIYEDLFKPDTDTPTFEFIVQDHRKEQSASVEEEQIIAAQDEQILTEEYEQINAAQELPIITEDEEQILSKQQEEITAIDEEELIAEQDENIIQQSNPITQPITGYDPEPIPLETESEEDVFDETEDRTVIDPEEDEIGPEPFLVAKEPELPVEPGKAPEPVAQPTIQSSFSSAYQPTLNELLASRSSVVNNGTPENPKAPIADLKSAITINQKLIFVKDLFDGYNLAYSEAIDLLNKMPDFKTADKFLQSNYAIKHKWSSKQSTADQFYELLHQRFPK